METKGIGFYNEMTGHWLSAAYNLDRYRLMTSLPIPTYPYLSLTILTYPLTRLNSILISLLGCENRVLFEKKETCYEM